MQLEFCNFLFNLKILLLVELKDKNVDEVVFVYIYEFGLFLVLRGSK